VILIFTMNKDMLSRSLETLRSHSAQLVDVVGVNCIGVDDRWRIGLLYRLLSYLDAVVYYEQRVVGP